jgi:hypothetical protein
MDPVLAGSGCTSQSGRQKKGCFSMEEQQIRDFVHRASTDEALRKELTSNAEAVIMREGFSPRVARIMARLVPYLSVDRPLEVSFGWWG